nr:transposase [Candidatus Chloroploca sp. Khr17]
MQMKKVYTAAFKAQIVLELLKEAKSINQLAAEHGVAPTVLREWKQAALTSLPDLFERRDSVIELRAAHARELEHLYAEIGRLKTHVNFLKKSCRIDSC